MKPRYLFHLHGSGERNGAKVSFGKSIIPALEWQKGTSWDETVLKSEEI